MEEDSLNWKELDQTRSSFATGKKEVHVYMCEECNYHWEITEEEPNLDADNSEDILVDDMFSFREPEVCPMCGSTDCTER